MSLSTAQIALMVNDLIARETLQNEQYSNWVTGEAQGGDLNDGRYPLTDRNGNTLLFKSPAQLAFEVTGLTEIAGGEVVNIELAKVAAQTAAVDAGNSATQAAVIRDEAQAAAVSATAAVSAAQSAASEASDYRAGIQTVRSEVLAAKDEVTTLATTATDQVAQAQAAITEGVSASVNATAAAELASEKATEADNSAAAATAQSVSASLSSVSALLGAIMASREIVTRDDYLTEAIASVLFAPVNHTHDALQITVSDLSDPLTDVGDYRVTNGSGTDPIGGYVKFGTAPNVSWVQT